MLFRPARPRARDCRRARTGGRTCSRQGSGSAAARPIANSPRIDDPTILVCEDEEGLRFLEASKSVTASWRHETAMRHSGDRPDGEGAEGRTGPSGSARRRSLSRETVQPCRTGVGGRRAPGHGQGARVAPRRIGKADRLRPSRRNPVPASRCRPRGGSRCEPSDFARPAPHRRS